MPQPLLTVLLVLVGTAMVARACGVRYVGTTSGGWTVVHDDRHVMGERIRVLDVAGTYQSATYLDERWAEPVFAYHRTFDHLFDAWPDGDGPHSVAVLGGGGYAIPKHLVAHHPEVRSIDVVELDFDIERIARRHFFLDRLEHSFGAEREGRLRLHLDDAHHWLEVDERTHDAIINDCFSGLTPLRSLMDEEGVRLVHGRLAEGGVYLTNVVSSLEGAESEPLYTTIEALSGSFSHVWVYPLGKDRPWARENNIVIATDAPHVFEGAWRWPTAAGGRD